MTRLVDCRKYGEKLEGLEVPPLPGAKGQEIFDSISKKAWSEWQQLQTMLINEKQLSLIDPDARAYLGVQMEKFFNNDAVDHADGYVPPS